ncbi:MAG: ATP-binding protein [Chloroflexales bacterium]|nr:ATP-binding protein [Chloroflexales bacterium]
MAYRRPYRTELFLGRNQIATQLVQAICQALIGAEAVRSLLVEGPASQGKTWLLHRVAELTRECTNRIIVCWFHGPDFWNDEEPLPFEQVRGDLLVRLWQTIDEAIPDALRWPESVRQADPPRERARKFSHESVESLVREAIRVLETTPYRLLLVVDGLDEIPSAAIDDFSDGMIAALFRCPQTRLLWSRRVDSRHTWKDVEIKNRRHKFDLRDYDAYEQQINQILDSSGLTFADHIAPQMQAYQWGNPGANAFLCDRVVSNGGLIKGDDIRECILFLMRSPTHPHGSPPDFNRLSQAIQRHPRPDNPGISRMKLAELWNMRPDKQFNDFLGQLEERGIGFPSIPDGRSFVIYRDFVELFREYHVKEAL